MKATIPHKQPTSAITKGRSSKSLTEQKYALMNEKVD